MRQRFIRSSRFGTNSVILIFQQPTKNIHTVFRSTRPIITAVFPERSEGKFKDIEFDLRIKRLAKTDEVSNLITGSFSNTDSVRRQRAAPSQIIHI